jgi:Ni/Co efflux regulator RcnB
MTLAVRLHVAVMALMCTSVVAAQSTLGALLDANATKVSPSEFTEQLVQRTIVGQSPTGGRIELMYASNGAIHGVAQNPVHTSAIAPEQDVAGDWRIDDKERICTTLRIRTWGAGTLALPMRCQYWFKLGNQYFFADSDSDRGAKVLSRTIKQ